MTPEPSAKRPSRVEPAPADEVEEASQESFPASDPPSWDPLHPGPPTEHPARPQAPERDTPERKPRE